MEIVRMEFGSHLYGTDTPESDRDYKGVALPSLDQVLLGRIPHHVEHSSTGGNRSKNTSNDVDTEILSLHSFIQDALSGQTYAMDMLHCPAKNIIHADVIWNFIQEHRHKFYSKNVHAFIGYAVRQAAKYGVKGSRLNAAQDALNWLESKDETAKLGSLDLSDFPFGEHITNELQIVVANDIPMINVCGKRFQITVTVKYAKSIVSSFLKNYGERARKAANDEGIDWKAISHAFRAAYQMKELFTSNTITFPRPECNLLRDIKTGSFKYNDVAPVLERLIDEVKGLRDKSNLPETPDVKFWEDFLCQTVLDRIINFKEV